MKEGYVYILKSIINSSYYLGSSEDVYERFHQHNKGLVKSTRKYLPWKLVFFKKYPEITQARKIEYKLKKMKSKIILEKIIADRNIKLGI